MADSNIPPDIAKVTAPLLFGVIFNWTLYGALCVQTYVYSYNFPHDRRWMKALAYFVFLLETVQTALTGADAYYWFMAGFGNMERLRNSNFGGIDNPLIDAIISLVVQVFFCYRIWTLSDRSLWLPLLIVVFSIAQAIGAAWAGIKSATNGAYAIAKVAQYLWLITCTLVDILIAVVMTWLLRPRKDHEDQHSRHIVQRIMRLIIETNTVTASMALIAFVLYVAYPNEIYYTFSTVIIGKLYSNTLFVTLNNRIYFRDHSLQGSSGSGNSFFHPLAARLPPATPLNFAQAQSSQSFPTISTSIMLDTFLPSLATDPEKGNGDPVMIRSVTSETGTLHQVIHGETHGFMFKRTNPIGCRFSPHAGPLCELRFAVCLSQACALTSLVASHIS
ncbi:hypothetical protein BJV74DRAFT_473182 [Russula compacta]|nr:hypothetical protein BJV74DRAFT_473182 [Russula compacta]